MHRLGWLGAVVLALLSCVALAVVAPAGASIGRHFSARGHHGVRAVDVATDPTPLVPVDTMAFPDGATQSGIEVGDAFYPSKRGAWAQLVVLDRRNLEPVSGKFSDLANKAYFCRIAGQDWPCLESQKALRSDLARLGREDLVIVSSPFESRSGDIPYGLESALSRIGVLPTGYDKHEGPLCCASPGGISAIGVPGTAPGDGNWSAVPAVTLGAGRMRDFLVRNNENEYVFSPRDRIEFDTQAPGSNGTKNFIKVGNQTFDTNITSPYGGLQVVVVDRRSLTATSQFFETKFYVNTVKTLDNLAALLKRAAAGDNLVFIASRGDPATKVRQGGVDQPELNAKLQVIADEIEKLGGTRRGIFTALDPGLNHENSYSLVGWSRAGPGHGVQTLGVDTTPTPFSAALNTAPLTGTLARTGPNYAFAVDSSRLTAPERSGRDPSLGATELAQVALRPRSEGGWPERGNAGRTAAVKWIGEQVFGTDNPRGQYWTVPYVKGAFDYALWEEKARKIGKLDYADNSVFTEEDLDWAQTELRREIGWLISTHRYLDRLSTPFAQGQLLSWADFQEIANRIRDKVGVSPDAKTRANINAVFGGVRGLVDVVPGPQAKAVEAANAIYEMVADLIEINGEEAGNEFQARADELGKKLAERLSAAQAMLDRQLPNVISEDYDKLKTVGQCTSSDPQVWARCPFDHSDWEYTQDDQTDAAKRLRTELQIAAYGSLVPAKYTAYQLPLWWRTKVTDEFYGFQRIGAVRWYPFYGLPDSAQMAKPIYRNIPAYSHTVKLVGARYHSSGETWQITALGYVSGEGTFFSPWVMHYPEASVTDPLFISSADGGLGLDPETFFDANFSPKTLDHYPEKGISAGWCLDTEHRGCN